MFRNKLVNLYSNMKYYENIYNCLRVIQQSKNRKLKNDNCWQQTSLIQVNRLQEIMNNVDLPLVLTHPPEEVRWLDLRGRLLIYPFYVFQVNTIPNYTCIFFFSICACTLSTCSFVVFTSNTVAHGIVMLLKKIDILFYGHRVQSHNSLFKI